MLTNEDKERPSQARYQRHHGSYLPNTSAYIVNKLRQTKTIPALGIVQIEQSLLKKLSLGGTDVSELLWSSMTSVNWMLSNSGAAETESFQAG